MRQKSSTTKIWSNAAWRKIFLSALLVIFSFPASAKTIYETIVVGPGQTYDGKGETIVAVGLGDGGQGENQEPIFRLEKGATLKNVRIAFPGCDGVHCYGDNLVENVIWEDIGEDALTVKGGDTTDAGTITIRNCQAYSGDDKVCQINAPCTFSMENMTADGFGKVIRQNGGKTFLVNIYLSDCTFRNGKECIARTDSPVTQLYYSNLSITNVPQLWIFPSNSQIHENGNNTMEPTPSPTPIPTPPVLTSGAPLKLEAEEMSMNKAEIESEHGGFSGSGYVNFANEPGGYLEWSINSSTATKVTCTFIYANGGSNSRPLDITVNGNIITSNMDFPSTDAWNSWTPLSVSLQLDRGTSLFGVTGNGSEGGPNLDRIEMSMAANETPTEGPTPIITTKGDVNSDNIVNIVDALLIAQYYVNIANTQINLATADVNCDNVVNIVDALLIAQYYVHLINSFC
ncbi:MAG: pectate lyase [Spirochaetales bacterium]|nr:pectate lyase [Spirochaetales bacterium]